MDGNKFYSMRKCVQRCLAQQKHDSSCQHVTYAPSSSSTSTNDGVLCYGNSFRASDPLKRTVPLNYAFLYLSLPEWFLGKHI